MAPPPCGSVSGRAHVTGLGVWGPLPAAPWQRVRVRAVAPSPRWGYAVRIQNVLPSV